MTRTLVTGPLHSILREAYARKPMVYAYEPEQQQFKVRGVRGICWRGPHRFYHPDDAYPEDEHTPAVLCAVLVLRWQDEIWPWLRQQEITNEGLGKRSRWCRMGAFGLAFKRDEDAFAFRMRFC